MSLASVAAKGDRIATLCALRDKLAGWIDVCDEPRDIAALSARLADVLTQIASVEPSKTSKRDELARKRAERQRAASGDGGGSAADSEESAAGN